MKDDELFIINNCKVPQGIINKIKNRKWNSIFIDKVKLFGLIQHNYPFQNFDYFYDLKFINQLMLYPIELMITESHGLRKWINTYDEIIFLG